MTHPTDTLRLVPVEPTEAMLREGAAAVRDFYSAKGPYARTRAMWSAMLAAAPASPLPGGGWQELVDEIMQRAKTCEELITDDGDDFAGGRVSGKAQAYKHSAELIRAFLARNGKGEG